MITSRLRLVFAAGILLSTGAIFAGGYDEEAPLVDAVEQVAAPASTAGSLTARLLVCSYSLAGNAASGICSLVRENALPAVASYFLLTTVLPKIFMPYADVPADFDVPGADRPCVCRTAAAGGGCFGDCVDGALGGCGLDGYEDLI